MSELAKRAVACRHWRWLPGMRMLHPSMGPARVLRVTDQGVWVAKEESLASGFRVEEDGCVPDLNDPATLGCLLALVREAWEPNRGYDYIASTMHTGSGWGVGARYGSEGLAAIVLPTYETEAEALVAALEAAP